MQNSQSKEFKQTMVFEYNISFRFFTFQELMLDQEL